MDQIHTVLDAVWHVLTWVSLGFGAIVALIGVTVLRSARDVPTLVFGGAGIVAGLGLVMTSLSAIAG
jgi:hypothetical protein